jgi:muramoyltetrapeptide carboxypeptidase
MIDDPTIKAIWCARGGYGTIRIIDLLNFNKFKKNPKWIIGFSDITVLHSHIHNLNIESLHAQMPLEMETKSVASIDSIKSILFGESYSISVQSENALNRCGIATGQLVGGNLSVLYSMCGSPSGISTERKILFLEDIDEYLYHIDRMLQNLKRNGMLENLAGLVVGGFTQMQDNADPFGKTAEEIVMDIVSEYLLVNNVDKSTAEPRPYQLLRLMRDGQLPEETLVVKASHKERRQARKAEPQNQAFNTGVAGE